MFDLDEILEELEKKTKIKKEELLKMIEEKQEELSGLVSMEGAAHLVARDLGVDLLKLKKRELKIKDIKPGMRNINIKARIVDISPVREFVRKDGTQGRVCNLIISDGTAETRIPLWDKQVEMIEELIKKGDVIEIKNAVARDNIYGGVELSLLRSSNISKVEDDKTIPEERVGRVTRRIDIKNLREGYFEIRGNIVDVFSTNPIFYSCPKCRSKVEKTNGGFVCSEHGEIKPELNMVITGIVDDGTGSLRIVFFRDKAEEISNLNPEILEKMSQEEAINMIKENVLGKEMIFQGRVKINELFERPEMIVDNVIELDIMEESKTLINEIKSLK